MKLNVRPYPVIGESLDSFLFRLARVNGLKFSYLSSAFSTVTKTLKTRDKLQRDNILKKAEELCGHELSPYIVDIRQANRSYDSVIDFKKIRLCPLCFKESNGVIDSTCALKRVLVCQRHTVLIKDSCKSCGKPFTSDTVVSGQCSDCKESITENPWSISCDTFSATQSDKFVQIRSAPAAKDTTKSKQFNVLLDEVAQPVFRKWELATEITKLYEEWSQEKAIVQQDTSEHEYHQQVYAYSLYHDKPRIKEKLGSVLNKAYFAKQFNLQIVFLTLIKFAKIKETKFVFKLLKDLLVANRATFPDFEVHLTWLVSTGMVCGLSLEDLKAKYRPHLIKNNTSIYLKDFH